jgi:hypothetical protein
MCIYCGTKKYRKIYENHFGPIPEDDNGRKHEVHHIDGRHTNNCPTNLMCVSIKDHYDIHYSQGDWAACVKIAVRMKLSPHEISELGRKNALQMVERGTHPLVGGSVQRARVAAGTHHFLGPNNNQRRLLNGTHHFLDKTASVERSNNRVADGTHHFLGKGLSHPKTDKKLYCFEHKITKERVRLTQYEFVRKYEINQSQVCHLIQGKAKSAKKWMLVKD